MKDITEQFTEICGQLPRYCMEFFAAKYDSYMPKTKLGYAIDLRVFFWYLVDSGLSNAGQIRDVSLDELARLTAQDIEAYLMYLSKYRMPDAETGEVKLYENGPAGKRRKLATLKAFFKYFNKLEKLPKNPASLVDAPKLRDKEIVVLSKNEIDKIFTKVDTGEGKSPRAQKFHEKTKLRDMAILSLFLGTGLRVSELVSINLFDIDFDEQRIYVARKGGKREFVYFNSVVLADLMDYLELERPGLTGESSDSGTGTSSEANASSGIRSSSDLREDGPLFVSLRGTRITVQRVEQLVKDYARFVLPANVKVTPHALRKTFGTNLQRKYHDLYLTQHALSHSSPATTAKYYAKFDEERMKVMRDDPDAEDPDSRK